MSDKLKSFNQKYLYHIEKNIFSSLRKKYLLKNDYYGSVLINNIIYNCHAISTPTWICALTNCIKCITI